MQGARTPTHVWNSMHFALYHAVLTFLWKRLTVSLSWDSRRGSLKLEKFKVQSPSFARDPFKVLKGSLTRRSYVSVNFTTSRYFYILFLKESFQIIWLHKTYAKALFRKWFSIQWIFLECLIHARHCLGAGNTAMSNPKQRSLSSQS